MQDACAHGEFSNFTAVEKTTGDIRHFKVGEQGAARA